MLKAFQKISKIFATMSGSPWAFAAASTAIIIWAILGPVYGYSDTWQLVINTGTTIVTFLMVFLIQNTQNRDTLALQLKLDELIYANTKARNELIDLENLSDEEMGKLALEFGRLKKHFEDRAEEIEHKRNARHAVKKHLEK